MSSRSKGRNYIKKTCLNCKKEFYVYISEIKRNNGKFCSKKCFHEYCSNKNHPMWKGGLIKRNCKICKKEFLTTLSYIKRKGGILCSKKCCGKWLSITKRNRIKRICQICGKEIFVKPSQIKKGEGKFCSYSCNNMWRNSHSQHKNTSIEIAIEKELQRRNIKYLKQVAFPIAHTVVDFLLPETNTIIYCDGDYWHSKQEIKQRDKNQSFILAFYGYKVFRFTETQIKKSVKKCINRIKYD